MFFWKHPISSGGEGLLLYWHAYFYFKWCLKWETKNESKSHCHCINPDNPDRQPTNTLSSSSCMNQKPHQNPSPKSSQQSNPPRKSFENKRKSTRLNTHTQEKKRKAVVLTHRVRRAKQTRRSWGSNHS